MGEEEIARLKDLIATLLEVDGTTSGMRLQDIAQVDPIENRTTQAPEVTILDSRGASALRFGFSTGAKVGRGPEHEISGRRN